MILRLFLGSLSGLWIMTCWYVGFLMFKNEQVPLIRRIFWPFLFPILLEQRERARKFPRAKVINWGKFNRAWKDIKK